jgi:hypothetical protein
MAVAGPCCDPYPPPLASKLDDPVETLARVSVELCPLFSAATPAVVLEPPFPTVIVAAVPLVGFAVASK